MQQKDKTKWSYLAALIDGEGCISIWKTKSRAHDFAASGKTYGSFNLSVYIYNTNFSLMKWLIKYFGGRFKTRAHENPNHKTSYTWTPAGEGNTKRLLLGVLPYLVLKAEQAKLALRYIDLPRNCPAEREPLYNQLRILNHKGNSVETNTFDDSQESKRESDLISNDESAPAVMLAA